MSKRSTSRVASPASPPPNKVQKTTSRSHEENQERAYVAASRRTDRSTEARIRSARMASEVHKRRTGRAFKVSEEIVLNEEVYEEEGDENLAWRYRALSNQKLPDSLWLNRRLSACSSARNIVDTLTHQEVVNRMFAEQFPAASQISQHLARSMSRLPQDTASFAASASNVSRVEGPAPASERQMPDVPNGPAERQPEPAVAYLSPAQTLTEASVDEKELYPPALSPPSSDAGSPSDLPTPDSFVANAFRPLPMALQEPEATTHIFSAGNTIDPRLMANADLAASFSSTLYGSSERLGDNVYHCLPDASLTGLTKARVEAPVLDPWFGSLGHMDLPEWSGNNWTVDENGSADGDSWDAAIDPELWLDGLSG